MEQGQSNFCAAFLSRYFRLLDALSYHGYYSYSR